MKTFTYTVTDELGIHARPAGLMVKEAKLCESDITIECKGQTADLKKLFAVMGMGIKQGDVTTVSIVGSDEEKAVEVLEAFFRENF